MTNTNNSIAMDGDVYRLQNTYLYIKQYVQDGEWKNFIFTKEELDKFHENYLENIKEVDGQDFIKSTTISYNLKDFVHIFEGKYFDKDGFNPIKYLKEEKIDMGTILKEIDNEIKLEQEKIVLQKNSQTVESKQDRNISKEQSFEN